MVRRVAEGLVFVLLVALVASVTVFGSGAVSASGVALFGDDRGGDETDAVSVATDVASIQTVSTDVIASTVEEDEEFDRTVFRIEVFENGDARWTTRQSKALDNETEEEQFREFLEQFETEEMEPFENFQIRAQTLTEGGTEATGREMTATEFDRSGEVDVLGQPRGIIEMSFVWTNFAEEDDGRYVLADVFGGGWAINDDQRLQIVADENISVVSVDPDPDSGSVEEDSVTWFGPWEFADQRPRIEFALENETVGGPGDSVADDEPDEADDELNGDSGIGFLAVALVLVVLVGLGGSLAWYSGVIRRSGGDSESAVGGSTSMQSAGASTDSQTSGVGDVPPPIEEPLSDEDRVLDLLETNGGRMKQVNIVEETEWSKSKVSMLLSDMEEEGQISKLRVGRENIISLAGQEPEAAGSPFDDE